MSSYVVLARKWRPSQFKDIVGQTPVVRTLMNAIRTQRVHPAYLFTGSRGIGKTSIARIVARAIRCENTRPEGDWLVMCDQCSNCREIAAGTSVDVIEIDGASNNGVDSVREIRDNVQYLPASGAKKIYIIDEVHMLSTAAFNALLKTIEEPPPHIMFIFATTEPHKIPTTVLSRVQRFDFKRVTVAQIQSRLREICLAEGIAMDDGAMALIGQAAEGSMRDAVSILDQVIAYAGAEVTGRHVRESIGLIESETINNVLRFVLEKKPLEALEAVASAYEQGHDLRILLKGLIGVLHRLILLKVGVGTDEELASMVPLRELEELEMIFQVFHNAMDWVSRSSEPKVVLDVLVVKCATAEALVYVGQAKTNGGSGTSTKPVVHVAASNACVQAGVKTWDGFIQYVRQSRPMVAALLEYVSDAQLPRSGQGSSVLALDFHTEHQFKVEQLQLPLYRQQMRTLAQEYFGFPVEIRCEIKASASESPADRKKREAESKDTAARDALKNHPIVKEAQALFSGQLGPVEEVGSDG